MTVFFLGLPITSIQNQTLAVEGRKAHLICNISNDVDAPNPEVKWYKDGLQVIEVQNHTYINNNNEMTESILQFGNVSRNDSGEYKCRAYVQDPKFYTESSTLLIVERKYPFFK